MVELKMSEQESSQLMQELLEDGFVDDVRFAESFVRSKMTYNRWGRVKIRAELLKRGVEDDIIAEKLKMMDVDVYVKNLQYLAERWYQENPSKGSDSLVRSLLSKGYTFDEIYRFALNRMK